MSENKAFNCLTAANDSYDHAGNSRLMYTVENCPGAGCPDEFYEQLSGCECSDCGSDSLCHICSSMPYELVNGIKRIKTEFLYRNQPITECNRECHCDSKCLRKYVQHGPVIGLRVADTGARGLGLFTTCLIPARAFVCCYAGEVIGAREATCRYSRQVGSNYIMAMQEHGASSTSVTYIDATEVCNVGHYINHSCSPCLIALPVRIDSPIPHCALFAVRDIVPGEELTYDYGPQSYKETHGKSPEMCSDDNGQTCKSASNKLMKSKRHSTGMKMEVLESSVGECKRARLDIGTCSTQPELSRAVSDGQVTAQKESGSEVLNKIPVGEKSNARLVKNEEHYFERNRMTRIENLEKDKECETDDGFLKNAICVEKSKMDVESKCDVKNEDKNVEIECREARSKDTNLLNKYKQETNKDNGRNEVGSEGEKRTPCLCGSKLCRGYLPYDQLINSSMPFPR